MLFNGWLIDWVSVARTLFHFFVGRHLRFRLHFCFLRRMITMPIGRLELAEFGRFVSRKYRFLKCADFEAYPRTDTWLKNLMTSLIDFRLSVYQKGRGSIPFRLATTNGRSALDISSGKGRQSSAGTMTDVPACSESSSRTLAQSSRGARLLLVPR